MNSIKATSNYLVAVALLAVLVVVVSLAGTVMLVTDVASYSVVFECVHKELPIIR